MLGRRRTGSVVCPGCGRLVGAGESRCPFCGRPAPGMFGLTALTRKLGLRLGLWPIVAGGCGLLYILTLAVDWHGLAGGGLDIGAPSSRAVFLFGDTGRYPVLVYGRWWTFLSAGWLHGGLLHIGLNLYGIWLLAGAVEEMYGVGRALIIYTLSSVTGFLASTFAPFAAASFTLGASAALMGLLGALLHYSRRAGSRALGQWVWSWVLMTFVFGLMPGLHVDNWAHLGGFVGGWLLSYWLDPLKPERVDHLIGGVLCLLASAGAVVWSVVTLWAR